ncbi:hypothetical protein QEH42_gp170 [Microbacterium phage Pumpernickel]|uniref:Uncharacterized protein n=1 Tax=Microbacterium phage Pumpernickel TaxID=2885983 RepID=A0AAE8Y8K4_9CAUD|nr:hypothetical protein QEH42_gp170 [Microbacterium phage Pumpernickel]UDL16048.1 hypothetical protein SEA_PUMPERNICKEL_298 [Microbacterium phage Pumpernickel]
MTHEEENDILILRYEADYERRLREDAEHRLEDTEAALATVRDNLDSVEQSLIESRNMAFSWLNQAGEYKKKLDDIEAVLSELGPTEILHDVKIELLKRLDPE